MVGVLRKAGKRLYSNTALIIILILWEALPRAGVIPENYLPPLTEVIKEVIRELRQGYLLLNISLSLFRVFAGLLLASGLGVGLGLLLGYFLPGLSRRLSPLLRFFGQINPYSLLPLFIVFLGIGERAKIGMVVWTAVWPILFHTITGVSNPEPELLKSAKSMGATRVEILCKIILPASGSSVFDGLRVGVEMAFFILIAAEMTGGTGGLGAAIHLSGMNFLIPQLFAAGLCIVILGVVINRFFYYIQKRVFFWKETTRFFHTEKAAGHDKSLGIKGTAVIVILCVLILAVGFFQSRKAYKLMNTPNASEGFGHFYTE